MTLTGFMTWVWNTPDNLGPQMYSYFHIIWLVIMVALCVGSYFYAKRFKDPKVVDRTILIVDMTLFVTEILKQIMYQFGYYHYLRIDVLPFSFCSIPLYVAFVGSLVKNEKVKNACYAFLAFYGIVGGLCAMLYPVTLQTRFVYISFQTMYWHTMLVVMAVYLIFAKGYGKSFKKEAIPPFLMFVCFSLVAVGFNEITYHAYLKPRQTPTFSIDSNPASYDYLSYGYEKDGSYYFIKEDGNTIGITTNYEESINLYIGYPEGDDSYSTYTLIYCGKDDANKYIEINDAKEVVIVDTPTNCWEWSYITSDKAVFSMNVDGVDYCLSFENDAINVKNVANCDENAQFGTFIKAHAKSLGDSADFFFISNHNLTPIPVLNLIQPHVPYPVFVLIYISGFFGISSATWGVTFGIRKLVENKNKKLSPTQG